MLYTIHQPVKTRKQVNRVVPLPADISLALFLVRTKSLASLTLAEVAMQAKICDGIFLGRRGKFRGRASALRVPLARPKAEILATHANAPATRTIDATHAEKKRERNLHQQDTSVVIFTISFRNRSWFIFWHTNSPKPSSLYVTNSYRRTFNRFGGAI